MEYIIVFDPDQKNHCLMETNHYFLETYSNYEDAKKDAEAWKKAGECKSYGIYVKCTDEKNYLV